jgi:hypothetical protein
MAVLLSIQIAEHRLRETVSLQFCALDDQGLQVVQKIELENNRRRDNTRSDL